LKIIQKSISFQKEPIQTNFEDKKKAFASDAKVRNTAECNCTPVLLTFSFTKQGQRMHRVSHTHCWLIVGMEKHKGHEEKATICLKRV